MFLKAFDNRSINWTRMARKTWENSAWQRQQTIQTVAQLLRVFPHLAKQELDSARIWQRHGLRFRLTPYLISLIRRDHDGNPASDDPIWRQAFPNFSMIADSLGQQRLDEYHPDRENWEVQAEMVTPIAQHKYDDRVIIYLTDTCLAYCTYCLRSLQSTATEERHGGPQYWPETLAYLRTHPEVWEVILSGGDPLVLDDDRLRQLLIDLRSIPTIQSIRIHSRAWTHNPFRFTKELARILRDHAVTALSVHVCHPQELSQEMAEAILRVRRFHPLVHLRSQIPLIKGVNDDPVVLAELLRALTLMGVTPYYLLHAMPNLPAARAQRTRVQRGVAIMNCLGRRQAGITLPNYVIVHRSGKRTVPLQPAGTDDFSYTTDETGWPIVRFVDWQGHWQKYLDAPEMDEGLND